MDLSSIGKAKNSLDVSFQGHKVVKDDMGNNLMRFFPPHHIKVNKNKGEKLSLEIVKMQKQEGSSEATYGWKVTSQKPIPMPITDKEVLDGKKSYFDADLKPLRIAKDSEFGFRYVVTDKDGNKTYYTDDIGTEVDSGFGNFTIATMGVGPVRNQGPMAHLYIDSYNAKEKVEEKVAPLTDDTEDEIDIIKRNHFNRMGGNIDGIIDKLDTELANVKLIMTNPMIGGGITASHNYHPANHFHISDGIGSKDKFLELQTKCFNAGKGYVLDGAFTSQGYEGLQFNHVLQHDDSPFKYWFKNPPQEGRGYELRVLPENDTEHVGIRIVNPKGVEGYQYNKDMPTYIQFYDTRLVSEEQLKDHGTLIKQYDKYMADDPYEISNWSDGTLNNYFEIDPNDERYKGRTYGNYEDWSQNSKKGGDGVLNPARRNFGFTIMSEAGGYAGWDGNIDMVKMNLSNFDRDPKLKEGNVQAKNYIFNIASYWTKQTRNALIMDVAHKLHGQKDIDKYFKDLETKHEIDNPGALSRIYSKITSGAQNQYNFKIGGDKRDSNTILFERILEFPLESLNFSGELLGVLSTPYITPRPTKEDNVASSKTEIYEDASKNGFHPLSNAMKTVYEETLPTMIKNIMSEVQDSSKPLMKQNGNNFELTDYGKYFLEVATDDIMQFLITEGLFEGDNKGFDKDGKLDYEGSDARFGNVKGNGKRLTLNKALKGAVKVTAKDEAETIANKLKDGLSGLLRNKDKADEYGKLIKYLKDKYYNGANLNDYKMAEAVVDQTKAGLNWRFDAAKDVADWDDARESNGEITAGDTMNKIIDFWKPFVKKIKDVNDGSYIIAEITSLWDFQNGDKLVYAGKYKAPDNRDPEKAERNYYEETFATTGSNYSVTFGLFPKLFGKNVEEGSVDNYRSIANFVNKMNEFIKPGTVSAKNERGNVFSEFIIGSHVFLDNHDKPRAAHLMAVDADLFWSGRENKFLNNYAERAQEIMGRPISDDMNSAAVAVAEQYLKHFENVGKSEEFGFDDNQIEILKKAVRHLANGYKYESTKEGRPDFKRADAFAFTPYEISIPHVIKQAQKMGLKISRPKERLLSQKVHEKMLEPYASKMISIYEMMNGATGIPTLFAGDELLQTGCETKSKNYALGCRNLIRHDWLKTRDYVKNYNDRINAISGLNKVAGMAPLSGGIPVVIPEIDKLPIDQFIDGYMGAANSLDNARKMGKDIVADLDTRYSGKEINDNDPKKGEKWKQLEKNLQNELKATLKKMKPDDARKLMLKNINEIKSSNWGLYEWIVNYNVLPKFNSLNIQNGAIYKYNDKGDGVLSIMTNAYMPNDVNEVRGLLKKAENPPKISDITLKDINGNMVVSAGTIFERMTYDPNEKKYKAMGRFKVNEQGHLEGDGIYKQAALDSTVTYFRRVTPRTLFFSSAAA